MKYDWFILVPVKVKKECPKEKGFCVTSHGYDQNSGVIKLNSINGNTRKRQAACLKMCKAFGGATGCEEIWNRKNRGCYVHTKTISRGNGVRNHACWVFSKCHGRTIIYRYFCLDLIPATEVVI